MKRILRHPVIVFALAGYVTASGPTWAKSPAHSKKTVHTAKAAPKHTPAAPSDNAGNWKPDANLLAQLQPEQSFGSYRMRIPSGYTVKEDDKTTEKGQLATFHVTGPKHPDGSSPYFVISTALAGPGYVAASVDLVLHRELLLQEQPGIILSDMEDGQAGDMEMSRIYFKFQEAKEHIHGFRYAATDSHTNVRITFADDEPYSAKTLPVAEAAVLTLNKPE